MKIWPKFASIAQIEAESLRQCNRKCNDRDSTGHRVTRRTAILARLQSDPMPNVLGKFSEPTYSAMRIVGSLRACGYCPSQWSNSRFRRVAETRGRFSTGYRRS
jgi:hypothetical protein